MSKKNISVLILILLTCIVYSQKTVTGIVLEEQENLALPGVLITEKGTGNSAMTDSNGSYEITVSDSTSALIFSSIGYITREIILDGQSVINTTLKPFLMYEAWDQKLRFFLKSGLLENPVGGQFEFAIPTFINALSLFGDFSYQTNFKENEYFDAGLELNGVRLFYSSDFFLGIGIESDYRQIYSGNNSFASFSFETKWWSSLPFDVIAGYSRINWDRAGDDIRNGIIIGTEFWISKPIEIRIEGKTAFVKELIEYQAEIRTRFGKYKRFHSFVKYYNIGTYTELSVGIGIELTYHFKYQKNEY
jgi:hypothetical protein